MLAVHNYHDHHTALPTATAEVNFKDNTRAHNFSCQFHMLPYLEGMPRYSEIVNSPDLIAVAADNDLLRGKIAVYLCPSDPSSGRPGIFNNLTRCNIMTCRGDFSLHNAIFSGTPAGIIASAIGRAPFMITNNADSFTIATQNVWRGFEGITDGTSNTMAISEAASNESPESRSIFGAVSQYTISGDATSALPPSGCFDLIDPSTLQYTSTAPLATALYRGCVMTDGRPARSGFTACLPPNSPSCLNNVVDPERRMGYFSATSFHGNGVNIGMFDGAVRYVANSIDAGRMTDQQAYNGERSPYGVWGALGTIAQGESVSF